MRERAKQAASRCRKKSPPKPLQVDADHRAIKQILLNLLSNAVEFTPEGGRVITRAVHGTLPLRYPSKTPAWAFRRTSSTGSAIPSCSCATTRARRMKVRGFGLALVRSLAEMHGGQLRIDSIEGRGTTVTVEIPLDFKMSLVAA